MAKINKSKKSPSRIRYENSHHVFSTRLDRDSFDELNRNLKVTGCSRADFVKDKLGREQSMVKKRVEILASTEIIAPLEERIRELEDLVCQILSVPSVTDEFPPFCPHCDGQLLLKCEADEMYSAYVGVLTWKCPKCGFFVNTYKRIDPKSIERRDPQYSKPTDNLKVSSKCPRKKSK